MIQRDPPHDDGGHIEDRAVDTLSVIAEQIHGRPLHQHSIDWFITNGVNWESLVKSPSGDHDLLLIDDVVWLPHCTFEFARYSRSTKIDSACTFVVRDAAGDPLDVVAWQAETGRLATWLRRASLIGEDQIFAPRLTEELPVYENPLFWLRDRRAGVVLIDKTRAAIKLRDASALLAQSISHGEELERMLRTSAPRILVPAVEKAVTVVA